MNNYMEQCPSWETNRYSASHEIPRILWNPDIRYRFQHNPPPVRNFEPAQSSPCHRLTSWRNVLIISI